LELEIGFMTKAKFTMMMFGPWIGWYIHSTRFPNPFIDPQTQIRKPKYSKAQNKKSKKYPLDG